MGEMGRYKKYMQSVGKPYLLSFKRSTLRFGTFYMAREFSIFVNLVRSHLHLSLIHI